MSSRLSVIVITRNEELDLPACLESFRGLDAEIVVVDNHSSDCTREIAEAAGAKVFTRDFDGYAPQKQSALDRTTGDWVLSLDADERLTPELREEIAGVCADSNGSGPIGYEIPFRVHFMGRRLRFGGLGGERHLRLFRRSRGRFGGGKVHEGIAVEGKTGLLRGAIEHYPYRDLDEYLEKMRVYTSQAAAQRREQGRRFRALHHLLPFWEFFRRVFLRLGIFDGTPGVVWAGLSSFHTWVKYLKLRDLQQLDRGGDR